MNGILSIIYLIATITFIVGLKELGHPATAKRGNRIAAIGMALAIMGTLVLHDYQVAPKIYLLIGAAILLGALLGAGMAIKVKMTKMPELVSLFNGFGGASAALIGLVAFKEISADPVEQATVLSGIMIGSLTFSGSIVAWGKLDGTIRSLIRLPGQQLLNNILFLFLIILAVLMVAGGWQNPVIVYGLLAGSLLYGVLFVLPIGGADMPVVISLLNSLTGIAAAITGVLYDNTVMLIGGILVGSAGIILTIAMCRAMNRTLAAVIFGSFGGDDIETDSSANTGTVKKTTAEDCAILLNYANNVVIVPGYGLAVAQAQHIIHEMEEVLTSRGVHVSYAIHPVAGRMPGHMNVLLAESNVDYALLKEMSDINPQFAHTDVVFVVGANDVVNPAALKNPNSPIYGMPILEVENARQIIVNKRSMSFGYAGIDNELFYNTKTSMLFGDAKKAISDIVEALKRM